LTLRRIKVGFGNKKLNLEARELSSPEMLLGLMFKNKSCDNLLFNIGGNWGIHSLFVFSPFLALWLDDKNKVLEWKIVRPFSLFVKPKRKFSKLVEIPLNSKNKNLLSNFPTLGKV